MRKKNMSADQLQDRDTFVAILKKAEWEEGEFNKLFEDGFNAPEEAHMEYRTGTIELSAGYLAPDRAIDFFLGYGPNTIRLNIQFDHKLRELLAVVVNHQDKLSPSTYKTCLREMLQVCPTIFVVQGEEGDEFIPLTDTKGGLD
ncbi:MAG: hypothetical protein M3Z04_16565 [Chloroflexota bacterium]|nr:hypothetical protein [Chloroflexota bacterium]